MPKITDNTKENTVIACAHFKTRANMWVTQEC